MNGKYFPGEVAEKGWNRRTLDRNSSFPTSLRHPSHVGVQCVNTGIFLFSLNSIKVLLLQLLIAVLLNPSANKVALF